MKKILIFVLFFSILTVRYAFCTELSKYGPQLIPQMEGLSLGMFKDEFLKQSQALNIQKETSAPGLPPTQELYTANIAINIVTAQILLELNNNQLTSIMLFIPPVEVNQEQLRSQFNELLNFLTNLYGQPTNQTSTQAFWNDGKLELGMGWHPMAQQFTMVWMFVEELESMSIPKESYALDHPDLQKIKDMISNKNYQEAITELDAFIAQNKGVAEAYYLRGKAYAYSGDLAYSTSWFVTPPEHPPTEEEYRKILKIVDDNQNSVQQAILNFSIAIMINPNHVDALTHRAVMYFLSDNLSASLADAENLKNLGSPLNSKFFGALMGAQLVK